MSHFSDIGFQVKSPDDMVELTKRVANKGIEYRTAKGTYLHYRTKSGAELWIQFNKVPQLIGLLPHFHGSSVIEVHIKPMVNTKGSELDGSYYGELGSSIENSLYPLYIDSPNFYTTIPEAVFRTVKMQITAFANIIDFYPDEQSFSKADKDLKLAPQAFIPAGLFTPDMKNNSEPEAQAIMSGTVLQCKLLTNELTNEKFYWMLVESYGATYDMVADPKLLKQEPKVGGIVSGNFWLSGSILPDLDKTAYKARITKAVIKKAFIAAVIAVVLGFISPFTTKDNQFVIKTWKEMIYPVFLIYFFVINFLLILMFTKWGKYKLITLKDLKKVKNEQLKLITNTYYRPNIQNSHSLADAIRYEQDTGDKIGKEFKPGTGEIRPEQVVAILSGLSPSFKEKWDKNFSSWKDGLESMAASLFSSQLVELQKKKETSEFLKFFKQVEEFITKGDDKVQYTFTIGFLEDLQNNARNEQVDAKEFEIYLQPETKKWWDDINRFWSNLEIYNNEKFKQGA